MPAMQMTVSTGFPSKCCPKMPMSDLLYSIEGLEKGREGAQGYCLSIPRFTLKRGEKVALTGESGCGKSTALDMLGFVLAPDRASRFLFESEEKRWDIWNLYRRKASEQLCALRLAHLGYVLQTGELLPFLSVAQNMTLVARMRGMEENDALERAHALALRLGIAQRMQAQPATLSVGERQRVAIVRALLPKPEVILADEPTAALDPMHAQTVLETFLEAVDEEGATLIMVSHNVHWVRSSTLREWHFDLEKTADGTHAVLCS